MIGVYVVILYMVGFGSVSWLKKSISDDLDPYHSNALSSSLTHPCSSNPFLTCVWACSIWHKRGHLGDCFSLWNQLLEIRSSVPEGSNVNSRSAHVGGVGTALEISSAVLKTRNDELSNCWDTTSARSPLSGWRGGWVRVNERRDPVILNNTTRSTLELRREQLRFTHLAGIYIPKWVRVVNFESLRGPGISVTEIWAIEKWNFYRP